MPVYQYAKTADPATIEAIRSETRTYHAFVDQCNEFVGRVGGTNGLIRRTSWSVRLGGVEFPAKPDGWRNGFKKGVYVPRRDNPLCVEWDRLWFSRPEIPSAPHLVETTGYWLFPHIFVSGGLGWFVMGRPSDDEATRLGGQWTECLPSEALAAEKNAEV
ncbi:hypothetical protein GCM10009785_13800 [Brooklawnia cerclae]|uniref:Uncharacterized protein n=1 Tax=Brooklawnia cerclae TaxID=349934 RepID=A0ABX0SJB6_9ACTN|nr:hypothetical protein [Brooklawnia cerclae]NIH58052.1 hypothetical protein [Brooklawnia cerclae]NIH58517.1 hypothetical protein [Brooklawnia cerclae]